MTTAPDRNWDSLLGGLDNNNIGGITEEDIRSIAAYSRHSHFTQTFVDTTALDTLNWGDLPDYEGVKWLKLQSRFGTSPSTYREVSGSLASSTNGALYAQGNPATDGATQERLFGFSWNISISSSWRSSWGVSWWVLKDGTAWPAHDDEWPAEGIYLLGTYQFNAPDNSGRDPSNNQWISVGGGSSTGALEPGDTLVPILEFYGNYDSTGASPAGTVRFSYTVSSLGPTSDSLTVTGDSSVFENFSGMPESRISYAAGTDVAAGGTRSEAIQVFDEFPNTGRYTHMVVYESDTETLGIYDNNVWNVLSRSVSVVSNRPSFAYEGQVFLETSSNKLLIRVGGTYREIETTAA